MKFPSRRHFFFPVMWILSLAIGLTSCRKNEPKGQPPVPVVVAPELLKNGLGEIPGAVYRNQESSEIAWQPWTPETFERARQANRLLLVVIAMPQQPAFSEVLRHLAADPVAMTAIEKSVVPVLVDGDAVRELGLLTADLCTEIRRPVGLPLFVWMTHEASPVAWIPVSGDAARIRKEFDQSQTMVSRMVADSPDYVLKNSAIDQANRRLRIAARRNEEVASEEPAVDTVRGIRQLTSLYDPVSRTFDEAGGLFPAGSLDLLAGAAMTPSLAPDLRARCVETLRELMLDLLPSAMFDPLDGGLYSSRRGNSWALPTFVRDTVTQARSVVALIRVHEATGDPLTLERALAVLKFAEREYQVAGGLYSIGFQPTTATEHWLWSVEDVERALSAEDAAWWIRATGMQGLGNLPSETDPQRKYFRRNSLATSGRVADIAGPLGISAEKFDEVRKTLLKARSQRLGELPKDETAHATSTFRMISAFAAAYTATGDETWRAKAVELLGNARKAFSDGRGLRQYDREGPASVIAGRAFLYALALLAILDVHDIQPDEALLAWADDLATTAAERFTADDFIKECPDDAKLIDLPITDLAMLFDDSTAGLLSAVESRMAALGRPLVVNFSRLATPLPVFAANRPVLHTDLLQATLMRHHGVTAVYGKNLPSELAAALSRLPIRTVLRRPATAEDALPEGTVRLISGGTPLGDFSSAADLRAALLPSATNQ